MSTIQAEGVGVRHAVARALATANQSLAEATWRLQGARVELDAKARVRRAAVQLTVEDPRPLHSRTPAQLMGLVNPDGHHPLMVWVEGPQPLFVDTFPVTWHRWLGQFDASLPPLLDPMTPRVDVTLDQADAFARRVGKRLPSVAEFAQAWGDARFPWGDERDPRRGRVRAPRFGEVPEVGLHPPSPLGLFDLGSWLWHWTSEGRLAGGSDDGEPGLDEAPGGRDPVGFRLVCDAGPAAATA